MWAGFSVGVWLAAAPVASVAQDVPLPIQVSDVRSAIADHETIGSKRQGLLCLPAGGLRWGDLARPNQDEMKVVAQTAVEMSGGTVSHNRRRDQPAEKLAITIASAKVKLCTAWNGLGRAPKGSGTIRVHFAATYAVGGAALGEQDVDQPLAIDGRDPRSDEDVLREALALAVRAYLQQRGG